MAKAARFGKKKSGKADARKFASFSGCGGKGGDPLMGGGVASGGVVSGSKNVNPPNANAYASFANVGGKNTKSR